MILFFYGDNTYAARSKLAELRRQFMAKNGNDFGLEEIEGERIGIQELMQQLQAMPFLATSRLIIIENLQKNKTAAEAFIEHLDEVPASTIVVLYDPQVDRRSKYFKALAKLPKAAEFKPLAPPALAKWLQDEATKRGAKLEPAAGRELLQRCGDDQWRLAAEVAKLADYNPTITANDVQEMVEASEEQSIFNFLDIVMQGNLQQSLASLGKLRAQGLAEMYIITMLLWQIRHVLLAKLSNATQSGELAKRTGISPYAAGKALNLARTTSEEHLKHFYNLGVDAEFGIKTGQAQPDELLENLVIKLCT